MKLCRVTNGIVLQAAFNSILLVAILLTAGCQSFVNSETQIAPLPIGPQREAIRKRVFDVSKSEITGKFSNNEIREIVEAAQSLDYLDNHIVAVVRLHVEEWNAVRLYTRDWRIDMVMTLTGKWVPIRAQLYAF
jgi:hypothetical protein